MNSARERITAIVGERASRLPAVERSFERWTHTNAALRALRTELARVRDHPGTDADVAVELDLSELDHLRAEVAELLGRQNRLVQRMGRTEVSIAVAGPMRVGKSTLVQSITGLTPAIIPSGDGRPVTATPVRIANTATGDEQRPTTVELRLRSFDDFVHEVVKPYHDTLGLDALPRTWAEFTGYDYGRHLSAGGAGLSTRDTLIERLRSMQAPLQPYHELLTHPSDTLTIPVDRLPEFITYPDDVAVNAGGNYLAVLDARIDIAFPADVGALTILDLPGLGEVSAEAELNQARRLGADADLILLVLLPTRVNASWAGTEAEVGDMVTAARDEGLDQDEFVAVVINDDGGAGAQLATMERSVRARFGRSPDPLVVTVDASDPTAVHGELLPTLLERLATTLPKMDDDLTEAVGRTETAVEARVRRLLSSVEASLGKLQPLSESELEQLIHRGEELQSDVAAALQTTLEHLKNRSSKRAALKQYYESVDRVHDELRQWIHDGFGQGEEAFRATLLRDMRRRKAAVGVLEDRASLIRIEMNRKYSEIEVDFESSIDDLRDQLGEALSDVFGDLLRGTTGREKLASLYEASKRVDTAGIGLELAFEPLLELKVTYRAQFYPFVRAYFRYLDPDGPELPGRLAGTRAPEVDRKARTLPIGRVRGRSRESFPISEAGAAAAYAELVKTAEYVAKGIRNTLCDDEMNPMTPTEVALAATEQFEDALVRSDQSAAVFRALVKAYRSSIWPDEYTRTDEMGAIVLGLRRALGEVRDSIG